VKTLDGPGFPGPRPLCSITCTGDPRHTLLRQVHDIIIQSFGSAQHFQRGGPVAKGRVSIVVERCKACGFCVEFCPTKVLALSSAFNSKGYHPPHVVAPEKCSGCDLCGMYCPDFAIYGQRLPVAKEVAPSRPTANNTEVARES
jgi:2-oxoglutarate ferredoxin oxidoreductase subunit delta